MKLAAVGALAVPTMVLVMTAAAIATPAGLASIFNPGAHGFTETLYAYTSQSNNNGSAFAGYAATTFSTTLGTVALYFGRFFPLLAGLAIGGSLAAKKVVPASAGTFRTDGGDVRRPAARRHRAHRRADDPAGPDARPDRGRADALMLRALFASVVAIVVFTVVLGFGYPALMTGVAQLTMSHQANGSLIERNGTGRRLVARRAGVHARRSYFHERPSATTPAVQPELHDVLEPRPDEPGAGEARQAERRRDPQARGAVQPRADDPPDPGRRRRAVGLRDRPRDLDRVRRTCRRGASPPCGTCRSRPCSG